MGTIQAAGRALLWKHSLRHRVENQNVKYRWTPCVGSMNMMGGFDGRVAQTRDCGGGLCVRSAYTVQAIGVCEGGQRMVNVRRMSQLGMCR